MSNHDQLSLLPKTTLVLAGDDHSGRDEMNLAGFPFALLQAATKNGQTRLRDEWPRRLANGKTVLASWEVDGHSELGLPGPTEEMLYLVLLQLTREAAGEAVPASEWPQKVFFSKRDVLNRLGWGNRASDHKALSDALTRLTAVSIAAEHSFYDARTKMPFAKINFGILAESALATESSGRKRRGATPLNWFEWSATLYASFTAGNVRSLALDFTLSLQIPTARRLFRFLEMMRHATPAPRREFSIGVLKLRDRLGMTPYKFPSKIKQVLEPAHAELIARGYLLAVEYQKAKGSGELACYRFGRVEMASDYPALPEVPQRPLKSPASTSVADTSTRADVLMGFELADEDRRAQMCNAVFEALDAGEQDAIRARVLAQMAPFLRENLTSLGARGEMTRGVRREVETLYADQLKAQALKLAEFCATNE